MVLLIALLLRTRLGLHRHVDERDIDLLARLILAGALMLVYLHAAGWFTAWLGEEGLRAALWTRMTGSYWPLYWGGLVLAVLPPQLFWWRGLRGNPIVGIVTTVLVLAGIYLDHLSIIVAGLQRGHLATTDALYSPTIAEASLLVGTIGLFALMVLLSVRRLPIVSLYETRAEGIGKS